MNKKCLRITGYTEEDEYGLCRSIHCGKDAPIEVLGFIESPFMSNHWQVEKNYVCEEHAAESQELSKKKKQRIIENYGKFVRIDKGIGNQMTHIPIEVPG